MVGDRIVIENHDDHPFNAVSLGGIYEVRGWDEYNEKLWIKNDTGAPQVFSEQRYFYNGFKLFDVGVIDNREVENMSAWVWILGWITICSMGMFGAAFAGYGRWKHVDRLVGGFFGLMVFGVLMLMVIAARAEEVETIIKVKESQELRAIYSDGDQWSGGFCLPLVVLVVMGLFIGIIIMMKILRAICMGKLRQVA